MEQPKRKNFQFYLQKYFKFPPEIRNDIVYCQRSMKEYINAYQTISAILEQKGKSVDSRTKVEILTDIEAEIYEINAEQQYLFLRLRRIIDEFNKMLTHNGIPINIAATNLKVSEQIIPLIDNIAVPINPTNVSFRRSQKKLLEDVENQCNQKPIEIDDDEIVIVNELSKRKKTTENIINNKIATPIASTVNTNQKSLLKPISQRMPSSNIKVIEKVIPKIIKNEIKEEKIIELPVSKDVRMSRLNLRQALKRAHSEANKVSTPNVQVAVNKKIPQLTAEVHPNSKGVTTSIKFSAPTGQIKTTEQKTRKPARNVSQAILPANKSPELTSSSEESNQCQDAVSTSSSNELRETRTQPEEYGKEMFLRIFQLYTPEMRAQMQQRRSKRKRRSVQNNERSDFHYGKLDGSMEAAPAKPTKRSSSDKSRSNSRSPTLL